MQELLDARFIGGFDVDADDRFGAGGSGQNPTPIGEQEFLPVGDVDAFDGAAGEIVAARLEALFETVLAGQPWSVAAGGADGAGGDEV